MIAESKKDALCREDLDLLAALGCENCGKENHSQDQLYLHVKCHLGHGLER